MKNSENTMWIVGAVLVSAFIAVLAWFFAISPQLSAASDARAQTASAKDFNDQLDIQILGLKKKEQEAPTWRGTMAAIAKDLPPTVDQSALQRFVTSTLEANKLPVINVEYGAPTVITPGTETTTPTTPGIEPTPAPSASPAPNPSASPSASPAPDAGTGTETPAATAPFQGLLEIPVTVTTEGNPASIMQVMHAIATTDTRFLTITNVTISKAPIQEQTPGRPALTESQWVHTVTFMAFVLYQDGVTLVPEEPGSNPPYTGGAVTNPFAPLPGTEQKTD